MALETLFLFGTLRYLPLLRVVLGREPDVSAAHFPNHVVRQVENEAHPMLVSAPGEVAEGLLVSDVTPDERARLDYYEAGFDFDLSEVTVETAQGARAAKAYLARGPQASDIPWVLHDWIARLGAMTLEAAGEIMRAYEAGIPAAALAHRLPIIRARAHATARLRDEQRAQTVGTTATRADVTIHQARYPYEAFFRVDEVSITHKAHAGGTIGPIERAVFNVSDAVTVLPYDPVRDRVLLIEQLRLGALLRGDTQPWMLEPVAGMIDAGETPAQTALRESHEEANLTLATSDLQHIATYYPSPGGVAQRFVSYVALCDLPDSAAGLGGEAAEHEDLRAHLVDFDDLMEMVRSGEAANAALIVSAQWLRAERDRLRSGG